MTDSPPDAEPKTSKKSDPATRLLKILAGVYIGSLAALAGAGYYRDPHIVRDCNWQTQAMVEAQKKIHAALSATILNDPGPAGNRVANLIVDKDADPYSQKDIYYSDHYHRWMNGSTAIDTQTFLQNVDLEIAGRNDKFVRGVWFSMGMSFNEGCHLLYLKHCNDMEGAHQAEVMRQLADNLARAVAAEPKKLAAQ